MDHPIKITMKSPSLFVLAILCSFLSLNEAKSQITLSLPDYASIGDSLVRGVDTIAPLALSVGGVGAQTWDFTTIQIDYLDSIDFIDPSTTSGAADFTASNLAYGTDPIYYQNTSVSNVTVDGSYGADPFGAGLQVSLVNNPTHKLIEFPSTDGSSFTDASAYITTIDAAPLALPVPNIDSIRLSHNSYITSVIDAYGNVSTPAGTFNSLRQFYTETTIDSIWAYCSDPAGCNVFVATLPFGWGFVPSQVTQLSIGLDNPGIDTSYLYKWWTNGQNLPIAELETDAPAGNVISANYDIGNSVIALIASSTDMVCSGNCSGAATVSGLGGVLPYTYLWDDPLAQTNATATGLCDITYTVTITDGALNTATATVTIGSPPPLSGIITTTDDDGSANGIATILVTGGTAPYMYSWNTSPTQVTASALNLASGAYIVTVTDANGCTYVDTATVVLVLNCNVTSSFTSSSANVCEGGTVNFTNTSLNTTTYNWLENGLSFSTTTDVSRTFNIAGTYTISLVAGDSICIDTSSVMITVTALPSIISEIPTDATACGVNDGTIIITASGGTAPLLYSIDGGANFFGSGGFTGLGTGNYDIAISDVNGCMVNGSTLMISAPGAPVTSAGVDDTICEGGTYILAGTMGGTATSIAWMSSGGGTFDDDTSLTATYTPSSFDITAGTAVLTITTDDPGGSCGVATDNMVLIINTNPAIPTVTQAGNSLACDTVASTYQWFFNSDTIQGAANQIHVATQNGFYQVAITDNNGCSSISVIASFTGVMSQDFIFGCEIYPNPSSGEFTLALDLEHKAQLTISVYHFTGKLIYTEEVKVSKSSFSREVNLDQYARGLYYVKVVADEGVITKKLLLQ